MGSDVQKALKGEVGGVDLEPTGAYESFTGGDRAEPIDFAANPIGSYMAYKGGNDVMDLGRMGGRAMAGWGAGVGLSAAGAGAAAPATEGAGESFTGGLAPNADAGASLGSGTGSSVPSSGLRYAGSEQVLGETLGQGGAAAQPGLQVSPQAMQAFNAGTNLPYASASGITAGGEGMNFNAPSSSAGNTAPQTQPSGLKVGPNAANELGTGSTPTGGGSTGPTTPASGAPAPQQGQGVVQQILAQMKANAVPLGIMGIALAGANQKPPMPNEEQQRQLSGEAQQTAQQLLAQYRSGQLSAGQTASLDQLTRQTKNQITQYFASIGQADSTSHQQALAQVDAQALQMKQQMLDSMLQQGLQAIGVAQGPLNSIAQYQMGQDQALRQAFGNFATAAGLMAGRNAGTPQPAAQPAPTMTQGAGSSAVRAPTIPESQPLG